MKKILFVLFCSFCFISVCKAECDYKAIREINTLATYVESNYVYDESTGKFTLTFTNIPDSLYIEINGKTYMPQNNEVVLRDFSMGEEIKGYIKTNLQISCLTETLRPISIKFPYLNEYFGSSECIGHENLEVCSHKFLNYQMTYRTFKKLLTENLDNVKNKPEEPDDVVKNKTFYETVLEYGKVIGIPLLLVSVTSLITFTICNIIYRKIVHGL